MRRFLLGATAALAMCAPAHSQSYPPPHPELPVVAVGDVDGDRDLDQADVNAALRACFPGCNLRFGPWTYENIAMTIGSFPKGFAMYGFGIGRTVLRLPVIRTEGPKTAVVSITVGAPPGVVIQDMSFDGRKQDQPVRVLTSGIDTKSNRGAVGSGIIRRIEAANFVRAGVMLGNSPGWIVEDSWVHAIGCHQVEEPCGSNLDPNPWDAFADDAKIPGRKAPGFGVLVLDQAAYSIVRRNYVRDVTKIGIEVWSTAEHPCGHEDNTHHVLVEGNFVNRALTGFAINGGCAVTFRNNTSSENGVPDTYMLSTGNGFTCREGGNGSSWIGNRALDNFGVGFNLLCSGAGGGLALVGNVSRGNCREATWDTADLRLSGSIPQPGFTWNSDIIVANHVSESPQCRHALRVERLRRVAIYGGRAIGGSESGLWIRQSRDVVVRSLSLTSSQPPATRDVGLLFDMSDEGLVNVVVQSDTQVTGFDEEYAYRQEDRSRTIGAVLYCRDEEPNPPPACQ